MGSARWVVRRTGWRLGRCTGKPLAADTTRKVRWADLGIGARLFRVAHGVWGAFNLGALAYVWVCAALRHRDRAVYASVALLGAEGAALVVGRGNCPFGPLQARLGDPEPMFEWVLPPRAAKAAIPILTAVTLAGFGALYLRRPKQCAG